MSGPFGTFTVNQGTTPWVVTGGGGGSTTGTQAVSGTIDLRNVGLTPLGAPTTAGTPATGTILSIQGNASGIPIPVSGNFSVATSTQGVSGTVFAQVTTVAGTPLGAPTTAGTPATGSILTIQGNASGIPVPVSGNFSTSTGYPFVGNADAQTAPATGAGVGMFAFNGLTGKWDRLKVDPFDSLRVDLNAGGTQFGAPTTAGTPATGAILSIQGNASGVPVPVSGTFNVSSTASFGFNSSLFKVRNAGAAANIKTTAASLYNLSIINTQTTLPCYVQLFSGIAANITLGTSTPDFEFLVAPNSQISYSFGDTSAGGVSFGGGLCVASTTLEGGSVASAAGVMLFGSYL